MPARLEASALSAAYGRAKVLFEIDIAVEAGEVAVLLGRNGAGKSTTLKVLMGLVPASAGEIRLDGTTITRLAPHRRARLGLGYVPEERRIFTELTVAENLETGRRPAPAGTRAWTEATVFELFPALAALSRRRGGTLSGGERQMLTIARTLMGNPRLMLIDEPSEGLAPLVRQQLAAAIVALKRAGIGLLISEQNLAFAEAVADRAHVIERGRLQFTGTMAALAQDEDARRRWLAV